VTTPSEIEIYQLTIENWCADAQRLREEIRRTVLHEVGHAVGMDHDDLHADGYD
jgi:predicted Zn-dependent protease with MMP-like domain